MSGEILSIERFPGINWSRFVVDHPDGYREFSFGLTRIRLDGELLKLTEDGLLIPCGAPRSNHSIIFFGQLDLRPTVKVLAEDQHPFILEDAQRINEVGGFTSEFLSAFQQMVTGRNVDNQAERLLLELRKINMANPEVIKQLGVLHDVLRAQVRQSLPERSVEIARRLKELRVKEFGEGHVGYMVGTWTPDWAIEHYLEKVTF